MLQSPGQNEFARALLQDIAPDEEEFLDAYQAAISGAVSNRRTGTGMGLPPEIVGALGMVAVLVSRSVFDRLLEWSENVAGEIAKKFLVDVGNDKLKKWLLAPSKESLSGVLTASGKLEILAILERDAKAASLSPEEVAKLRNAVVKRLELGGP